DQNVTRAPPIGYGARRPPPVRRREPPRGNRRARKPVRVVADLLGHLDEIAAARPVGIREGRPGETEAQLPSLLLDPWVLPPRREIGAHNRAHRYLHAQRSGRPASR